MNLIWASLVLGMCWGNEICKMAVVVLILMWILTELVFVGVVFSYLLPQRFSGVRSPVAVARQRLTRPLLSAEMSELPSGVKVSVVMLA